MEEEIFFSWKLNPFEAPPGTLVKVPWPDVTSWILKGWVMEIPLCGEAILRKEELSR